MQGRKINAQCSIKDCDRPAISTKPVVCCVMHKGRWQRLKSFDLPKWYKPAVTKDGYIRININGKRVQQHRYIMEQHLGRKLSPDEHVHHINRDKLDNRISNLRVVSPAEHGHIHERVMDHYLTKEKINEIMGTGNSFSGKRVRHKGSCMIRDCNKVSVGRFMCRRHYSRWDYYTNKR